MKRASYRDAVDMIAHNDEPTDRDLESIEAYTTTQLIASIFNVSAARVATDILRIREKREDAIARVQRDILHDRAGNDRAADHETQNGRYLDCGPLAWDDR